MPWEAPGCAVNPRRPEATSIVPLAGLSGLARIWATSALPFATTLAYAVFSEALNCWAPGSNSAVRLILAHALPVTGRYPAAA